MNLSSAAGRSDFREGAIRANRERNSEAHTGGPIDAWPSSEPHLVLARWQIRQWNLVRKAP